VRPQAKPHASGMKRFIPFGLVFVSLVPMLGGLTRLFGMATGLGPSEGQARFAADPIPAVLHIIGATSFATLGAFQFSPRLMQQRWHRIAGRVLALFGIVAALSGIWMALTWPGKEFESPALNVMRVTAGATMIVFIIVSVIAARKRDLVAHARFMTRAYALGAAAGTQFFTILPFLVFVSLRSANSYAILMAAAYLINIAVAEASLAQPRMTPRIGARSHSGSHPNKRAAQAKG
jgi:uncharacterized membrane protein